MSLQFNWRYRFWSFFFLSEAGAWFILKFNRELTTTVRAIANNAYWSTVLQTTNVVFVDVIKVYFFRLRATELICNCIVPSTRLFKTVHHSFVSFHEWLAAMTFRLHSRRRQSRSNVNGLSKSKVGTVLHYSFFKINTRIDLDLYPSIELHNIYFYFLSVFTGVRSRDFKVSAVMTDAAILLKSECYDRIFGCVKREIITR